MGVVLSPANLLAENIQGASIESSFFKQDDGLMELAVKEKEFFTTGGNSFLGNNSIYVLEEIGDFKITAYSSTVGQTDSTPFIMASGNHVYDGAVAANFLPLGTKIRFPNLYGEKIFIVEDRMNERFQDRIDIWFETRTDAKNFGMKRTNVQIVR